MCSSNNFATGITIAIWTVVQTSFHIIWVLFGYYLYVCRIKPSHYGAVILYLTYFYKDECGNITLNSDDVFIWKGQETNLATSIANDTEEEGIQDIVQVILETAVLPMESSAAGRTNLYFNIFIISDAVWIISAFLLFAGTCFQIRKCLSLLFYCPWLVVTAFVILLDVVASVHYGLDIYNIHNFTTWLSFIGVENYKDFTNYNSYDLSRIIPVSPAIFLCMLFSRILIIWVLNIVNFFQIMNVAVIAFQDNLDGKNPRYQRRAGNADRGKTNYLDTSASRIRSWQLFYGAIESTSTATRSSSDSSSKDCNSNKSEERSSEDSFKDEVVDADTLTRPPQSQTSFESYGKYISSVRDESSKSRPNVSSSTSNYYRGYPDVAEGINSNQSSRVVGGPLRSQLPWTYIEAPEKEYIKGLRGYQLSNVPVNDYNRFKTPRESYKNVKTDLDSTQL